MWVFTQTGFYSVVGYDPEREGSIASRDEDLLLVRSRVRDDLEGLRRWIPDLEIREDRGADYRFRIRVSREAWKRVLDAEVDALNYPNFKNRVAERQGHERHDTYMRVWSVMRRLQV